MTAAATTADATGLGEEPGVARVIATFGRQVLVETAAGERIRCQTRGKKSELVVGDRVRWQATGDGGVVTAMLERTSLFFRQDEWRTKSFAANLDQLLVLLAVDPPSSESQLARALIAARAADVPAFIGLNKIDLPGVAQARARLAPYVAMGVPVLEFALKADPAGARACLLPRLRDKTTLVLGPSGMGKSTLINRFVPGAEAQVGEVSRALNAGRHTTTSTTWYWLDAERRGALIDSPGFQEFGLRQVEPRRLASLMPDLAAHAGDCRFSNCTHLQEPGCSVRAAAAAGGISASRMRIYAQLYEELSQKSW
ncbi:MAG: ribosome small subunit-dependent GTPase A [Burkholderiales bacterium]|nr:ribosome small subunit-dependent GTPase A [Burkholderiales bacterium]